MSLLTDRPQCDIASAAMGRLHGSVGMRNERDANISLASSPTAWRPVPPPARVLTVGRVSEWIAVAVALLGALSALGVV